LVAWNLKFIYALMVVYGMGWGITNALNQILLMETVGLDKYVSALGTSGIINLSVVLY